MKLKIKVSVEQKYSAETGKPLRPWLTYEITTEDGATVAFLPWDYHTGEIRAASRELIEVLGLEIPANPLAQSEVVA